MVHACLEGVMVHDIPTSDADLHVIQIYSPEHMFLSRFHNEVFHIEGQNELLKK